MKWNKIVLSWIIPSQSRTQRPLVTAIFCDDDPWAITACYTVEYRRSSDILDHEQKTAALSKRIPTFEKNFDVPGGTGHVARHHDSTESSYHVAAVFCSMVLHRACIVALVRRMVYNRRYLRNFAPRPMSVPVAAPQGSMCSVQLYKNIKPCQHVAEVCRVSRQAYSAFGHRGSSASKHASNALWWLS